MSKNDTHGHLFTELLLFQHGGHDLHDVNVDKMNNPSLSWKLAKTGFPEVNFSDLQWRSIADLNFANFSP